LKLWTIGAAGAAAAMVAWACADGGESPTWSLSKPAYDPGGSAAMLLPSNDTRVNLYLLLADRRGAPVRGPNAKQEGPPLVLFPWTVMFTAALPSGDVSGQDYGGSRCQTNKSGAAEFVAAVRASGAVPEPEKQLLIAARQGLSAGAKPIEEYLPDMECKTGALTDAEVLRSRAGQDFATYLKGAQLFYAGDFDTAAGRFRALFGASDPWARETALYMVARTLLNRAIEKSIDEYGSLAAPDKRDMAAIAAAGAAFKAYLDAYPGGRYASSARGLMRRVHWLAGDQGALASEYDQLFSAPVRFAQAWPAVALVDEIDNKLPLPTNQPQDIREPILLAVADLRRMRSPAYGNDRASCCGPPITQSEIERQRPLFGNDTELYDYVRATEAYFVRRQPAEVLQLIPDAAGQQRFSYLQFSRQMLRGMALQDLKDRNARAFWLSLFRGATQPYQREAVELALAMDDEKSGRLDLVFAPSSPVKHPIIRELLLEHTAGPAILRQQASRSEVPQREREVALYMLLSKELRRGFYREFLGDVRLLPPDAPTDSYFAGATSYDPRFNSTPERPPLGLFGPKGKTGDFGCPALQATAAGLAQDPRAIRARLCLAEFFRANGFDGFDSWYGFDGSVEGNGLASTRPLFPVGTPYARLEVYQAIINDPAASADDKALALNRAIRCYAPAGVNSCSGKEVGKAQRRAWFDRLKSDYPQSRWAKDLKYYW
jgi:hypothetical protein